MMRAAFATLPWRLRPVLRTSAFAPSRCNVRAPGWIAAPPTRMCAGGPGGQDDSAMTAVQQKISAALEPTRLEVVPTYGDPNGSHVSITVVSNAFEGLSPVKRHQVVYKAIWEELSGPIHAVDELVTKTPDEDTQ